MTTEKGFGVLLIFGTLAEDRTTGQPFFCKTKRTAKKWSARSRFGVGIAHVERDLSGDVPTYTVNRVEYYR